MIEIRIHGRGGQGGVTLAKIMATSRFLVGKSVQVVAGESQNAGRLLRILKVGETISLDVAHKSGESLTILELTEEQRQRAK